MLQNFTKYCISNFRLIKNGKNLLKNIYMKEILKKIVLIIIILQTSIITKSQIDFYQKSFKDIVKIAYQQNKPIFLFLSNNNNECWWMENNVFNNRQISKFYNKNYVCAVFYGQINYEDLTTEKLKIKEYPYMLYYDINTESGYSLTGGRTEQQIYNYGVSVANEFKVLNVVKQKISSIGKNTRSSKYEISNNDGRYTIGVRGKRLMYGYPFPNSTSHFVINANNKKASNSPRFLIGSDLMISDNLNNKKSFFAKLFGFLKRKKKPKKVRLKSHKNVSYLSDTLLVRFDENNSMHSEISYEFNGLKITQKLSPLNKECIEVDKNDTTRYYKIDYIIENQTNKSIETGLLVLFDMMIDNNDAAQMDVFKFSQMNNLSSSRKNKRLRGKYAKYLKNDNIKRILVYKNKKLTKDLTADFRIITAPDEIHIGSWPTFYSVLWDVPEIKVGEKYYDSAIILKWNKKEYKPRSKQYYTTIFGLYNKGNLEIVPAGTNFTGTDTSGRHISIVKPQLTVKPDTIYVGQTALLEWKTKNPTNANVYISAKPRTKQRNRGRAYVKPNLTTAYHLQMLDNGKEIATATAKLVVLKRPKVKKIDIDGRFSMGTKETPITFGYPFPYSTSYFKLKHNEKYYSNNDILDNSEYLQGKQIPKEAQKNIIFYKTDNFEIIQKLIALDKKYKETNVKDAVFFRCEYIIKNLSKQKSKFDFKQILDLSAFISDSLILKLNSKPAKFNLSYFKNKVPKRILLSDYSSKLAIRLYTILKDYEQPKSVSIASWNFLKNLEIKPKYSDSTFYKNPAILLHWTKNIEASSITKFAFIIGTLNKKKLTFNYNKAKQINSFVVNFKTNKHTIQKNKKEDILNFIKNNKFDFIVLEGFTDNRGTLKTNHKLASDRINEIKHFIIDKTNTNSKNILNKVHGEFFSNIKSKNKEIDDSNERKVNILLFKIQ